MTIRADLQLCIIIAGLLCGVGVHNQSNFIYKSTSDYTSSSYQADMHVCEQALEQGQLGPSAILAVITPLLHQSLVGVRGQEGMPHKRKKQADSDKQKGQDAALAESAVQAVKAAAAVLEWAHYRQLLGR